MAIQAEKASTPELQKSCEKTLKENLVKLLARHQDNDMVLIAAHQRASMILKDLDQL